MISSLNSFVSSCARVCSAFENYTAKSLVKHLRQTTLMRIEKGADNGRIMFRNGVRCLQNSVYWVTKIFSAHLKKLHRCQIFLNFHLYISHVDIQIHAHNRKKKKRILKRKSEKNCKQQVKKPRSTRLFERNKSLEKYIILKVRNSSVFLFHFSL